MREYFELKNENEEEYYVIIIEYCINGDLLSYTTNIGFSCEAEKKNYKQLYSSDQISSQLKYRLLIKLI